MGGTYHRQCGRDPGAATRTPADPEGAPQRLRPFAHADQAESTAHAMRLSCPQTAAVVLDDEMEHVLARIERHGAGGRLAVSRHVVQRFLDDTVDADFDLRCKTILDRLDKMRLDAG